MSVRSPLLASLPSNTGEPVSVEFIEGTGKRRVTRRFSMTSGLVTPGNLLQAVGPYGTADGATWTGLVKPKPVDGTKVYPEAKLVDARIVSAPARAVEQGGADAMLRWVEVVYEETAYVLSDAVDYDAQGAITQRQRTVVLSVGQDLATVLPVPVGFTRVTIPEQISQGRRTFSVTDVLGDGVLNTGNSDEGEGVYAETTTAHPTEPSAPTLGSYSSYRKVWAKGFWTLTVRRRLTNAEAGTAGRVDRHQRAREDGSIVETASASETAPVTSLTGDNVYLIETGAVFRSGGVIGYSRTWVKTPADWALTDNVEWMRPGLAVMAGSPDVILELYPPMQRTYLGTIEYSYSTLEVPDEKWQPDEWAYYYVAYVDADGNRKSERQALNGYVGDSGFALSSGTGSWNGTPIVAPSVGNVVCATGARPSGTTIIDSRVRPYLCALDGTRIFEKRTEVIEA